MARARAGRVLYLTEVGFPYYILPQTIIMMAGFWLTRRELPVSFEFGLLTATTVGGCVIGHEIIRRIAILRPLFGLKSIRKASRRLQKSEPGPSQHRQPI